jgi:uncharacterized protein YndB with AHSA1/START domain
MSGRMETGGATAQPLEREVIITRVFDAPRELVFKAWTEPDRLMRWWGPQHWTNPVCDVDLRVGGSWRIVMRAPDGGEYPCGGEYLEIVEPELLVFTNNPYDGQGNALLEGLTSVTFEDLNGKTKLTLKTRAKGLVSYAAAMLEGMEMGWSQSLDRLVEDVAMARREIVISRVYDAPRELVFEAFTDLKHIDNWWGPRGFTTTTSQMDVRPGGTWLFMMRGPDGTDYPNLITYHEVSPPERLVYDHGDDRDPRLFHVTVTFVEQGGKTRLTMRSLFNSAAARDEVVTKYGAIEGGNQTLDRLEEQLAQNAAIGGGFAITRVFDAPRELVWKVFTEAEHLMRWWGPKGFTMLAAKLDLKPGGVFHYGMKSPDGHEMWGKFMYREIDPPKRMVLVNSFSDAAGGTIRHPMAPTWPLEVLNTMTLTEQGGKTTLTIVGAPFNATEEERKTFDAGRGSMQQGFTGTFDQLEAYLEKMQKGGRG